MTKKRQSKKITRTHVVDILGNVKGRDQPVMLLNEAIRFIQTLNAKVLSTDDYVFFDPFCKAGEILLATAFARQIHKGKTKKVLVKNVHKDMFSKNYFFALAPDEKHFRLSLRTFFGNEKSHEPKYEKIIRNGRYLSEENGYLDRKKFKEEINSMIEYIKTKAPRKKIIAVGNPPYQEADGGFGKSAKNIYQLFAEVLIKSPDISEFLIVIPSRWFVGGKGLNDFRDFMLKSPHIENLRYFSNASDVFPTVDINGGICFLHYNKSYNGKSNFTDGTHTQMVNFSEFDIIPDDPLSFPIVRKIKATWKNDFVDRVAFPRNAFDISTNYFDGKSPTSVSKSRCYPCLHKGKKIKLIPKDKVTKNTDIINLYKVSVPKAAGGSKGKRRSTIPLNQFFIIDKGMVATDTYNIVASFKSKVEAENLIEYLKTDFARYLVGLRKITQMVSRDSWAWVPLVDLNRKWTDKALYQLFKISHSEQQHIKNKLQEWSR